MTTYSEDRQILLRGGDGAVFQAAVTHREKKGKHTIVVTASDENLPRLRDYAFPVLELVARKHGISLECIRYFERGRDGAVFALNIKNAAASASGAATVGAPPALRRGTWCDEADLTRRLGNARLPEINLTFELRQAVTAPLTAPLTAPEQNASRPALRIQRLRHPRPH